MNSIQKYLVSILAAICVVGAFGIPLGSPKFFFEAIILELSFITLTVISFKNFKYAYIPNFIIAIIVIIGNTVSPKHLEIMSTLNPFYNAIVLFVGGYILQILLLVTNGIMIRQHRKTITK